ncbi:MAG: 2-succinyl-5-enolpyruvyl-6-hydroxy-3-cyclohexene-1-carboxylic-acid synthase, partial [Anaerolineae bacterium]|nr:2-succinyl-5-enolpyruvyl-6-hydroxy-3-cyclohexene-1-carboxylic-acid synthase [Anaerolineae bacterium]
MQSEIAPNRNLLWARVFVEELARCGLKSVCIAPGSRSTPLVMGFAERDDIRIYSHLDERSAAFFALGLALASDEPAAVLCTSGTATANFFPAIIEAYQSQVPLLILTADRAHELRESGANQTIDQVKLYGDQVLWSVDVALPERNPPALVIRSLRTLACRAYAKANGLRKGPVHLNFPFRKPLEPALVEGDNTEIPAEAQARPDGKPFVQFERGTPVVNAAQIKPVVDAIQQHERGLIVCGPRAFTGDVPDALYELAQVSRYPIVADPLSGVRFGNPPAGAVVMSSADSVTTPAPDVAIRFGSVPTSQRLNDSLNSSSIKHYVHISLSGEWADDSHRITHFVQADPALFCAELVWRINEDSTREEWQDDMRTRDQQFWEVVESESVQQNYFDGLVLYDVVEGIPDDSTLFVGNSLPVRHLDQFGQARSKRLHVYANRGASGIDGVVSSAFGAGAARPDKPLVLVIGDISLYHDMNGLLAV